MQEVLKASLGSPNVGLYDWQAVAIGLQMYHPFRSEHLPT